MLFLILAMFFQIPDPAAVRAKHAQENAARNAQIPAAMKERAARIHTYQLQAAAVAKRKAQQDAAKEAAKKKQ
jgi:type II secretory pathway component PulM